jgi:hypothetical protein
MHPRALLRRCVRFHSLLLKIGYRIISGFIVNIFLYSPIPNVLRLMYGVLLGWPLLHPPIPDIASFHSSFSLGLFQLQLADFC